MITTKSEYTLIQELILMEDRELAQKIELLIWQDDGQIRPDMLNTFLNAMNNSAIPEEFYEVARQIVNKSGYEFYLEDRVSGDAGRMFVAGSR